MLSAYLKLAQVHSWDSNLQPLLLLLAVQVTNGPNPADVLRDHELHVTWWQLKVKQEKLIPLGNCL